MGHSSENTIRSGQECKNRDNKMKRKVCVFYKNGKAAAETTANYPINCKTETKAAHGPPQTVKEPLFSMSENRGLVYLGANISNM